MTVSLSWFWQHEGAGPCPSSIPCSLREGAKVPCLAVIPLLHPGGFVPAHKMGRGTMGPAGHPPHWAWGRTPCWAPLPAPFLREDGVLWSSSPQSAPARNMPEPMGCPTAPTPTYISERGVVCMRFCFTDTRAFAAVVSFPGAASLCGSGPADPHHRADRLLAKEMLFSVINTAGGVLSTRKQQAVTVTTALFTAGSEHMDAATTLSMITNSLPLCKMGRHGDGDGSVHPSPSGVRPHSARTKSPAKDRLLFNPLDPPHTCAVFFLMDRDRELP